MPQFGLEETSGSQIELQGGYGGGGFIGGHLVKNLLDEGHELVCADLKPLEYWFQVFEKSKNYSVDLKEYENCIKVIQLIYRHYRSLTRNL